MLYVALLYAYTLCVGVCVVAWGSVVGAAVGCPQTLYPTYITFSSLLLLVYRVASEPYRYASPTYYIYILSVQGFKKKYIKTNIPSNAI